MFPDLIIRHKSELANTIDDKTNDETTYFDYRGLMEIHDWQGYWQQTNDVC